MIWNTFEVKPTLQERGYGGNKYKASEPILVRFTSAETEKLEYRVMLYEEVVVAEQIVASLYCPLMEESFTMDDLHKTIMAWTPII